MKSNTKAFIILILIASSLIVDVENRVRRNKHKKRIKSLKTNKTFSSFKDGVLTQEEKFKSFFIGFKEGFKKFLSSKFPGILQGEIDDALKECEEVAIKKYGGPDSINIKLSEFKKDCDKIINVKNTQPEDDLESFEVLGLENEKVSYVWADEEQARKKFEQEADELRKLLQKKTLELKDSITRELNQSESSTNNVRNTLNPSNSSTNHNKTKILRDTLQKIEKYEENICDLFTIPESWESEFRKILEAAFAGLNCIYEKIKGVNLDTIKSAIAKNFAIKFGKAVLGFVFPLVGLFFLLQSNLFYIEIAYIYGKLKTVGLSNGDILLIYEEIGQYVGENLAA
jgi:hypothetical protein